MSLDLNQTALQLDRMAVDLRARQDEQRLRLARALETFGSLESSYYESRRQQSEATLAWNIPKMVGDSVGGFSPPPLPEDFCVAAVDGSHIDVDRHIPVRCFLINIGISVLTYGSQSDAELYSRPRIYAQDHELMISESETSFHGQPIEGVVLGAKRMVEEVKALAEVIDNLATEKPTLAMMDGSLLMLGLVGRGYQDFVLRQLIDEGFVAALEELRKVAQERPLAVASYISLPRSAEVVNALRPVVCPYDLPACDIHCGGKFTEARPCDSTTAGLLDRNLFFHLLEPGQRSGVFSTQSRLIENSYRGHEVYFFYINAGEEIGRVEIPSWVASDEILLGMTHALVIDQCRKGPGYPTALIEAHQQAVVTSDDRRGFVELVESVLYNHQMPVYTSEKERSKRRRWV